MRFSQVGALPTRLGIYSEELQADAHAPNGQQEEISAKVALAAQGRRGYIARVPAPRNPFPGMNPFFQADWDDVHINLLTSIQSAISEELPSDLMVRAEERVQVAEVEKAYRVDVAIVEPWENGFPPVWRPEDQSARSTTVTEPLIIHVEPEKERWLEIRDVRGRVITVIEVLSPTNKSAGGAQTYRQKQRELLASGVNLVEIDLIRGGQHVVAVPLERLPSDAVAGYLICVARQLGGDPGRREVYPCPLRQPLPTIRVPLRAGDPDAPLALQRLIDECYRIGRYWLSDYTRELEPPLSAEDAAWVQERLQAAGLR
jgi:hypothetical protein